MRKSRIIVGLFTLWASCVFCNEMLLINSDQAEYDGKQIFLTGNVALDHDIGKISSDKMKLTTDNEEKRTQFTHLNMQNHVLIVLRDNGQLTCANAELDSLALKGRFTGAEDQEYVVFTEAAQERNGQESVPLILKSRAMNVYLDRTQQPAQGSHEGSFSVKSYVREIEAEDGVIINYNRDFIIVGDNGRYYRLPGRTANDLVGLISLQESQTNPCRITNSQGDNIRTAQINIDTLHRTLSLTAPDGSIQVSNDDGPNDIVDFKADILLWNEPEGKIKLCDHIVVKHSGLSWMFTTDRDVEFAYHILEGKKQLKTMESTGFIQLISIDKLDRSTLFTLSCRGKLLIDHIKQELGMSSEKGPQTKLLGEQILFQDKMGEVHADNVKLIYMMKNKELVPHRMLLEGNVRILNRFPQLAHKDTLFQYALADKAEYNFENKEMKFTSENKNRVLFYDKVNNLQVSAPGLKIKRDAVTKKDTIQGMGDVRFNFGDDELSHLKKRFMIKDSKDEKSDEKRTEMPGSQRTN